MTSTQFEENNTRFDPYKNFNYRIKWDGRYVAGVSEVSGLTRTTEDFSDREGGNTSITHESPVQTDHGAITLERGVTHDLEFETWADKVWSFANGSGEQQIPLKDFRKDIIIELCNEAGQKVMAYNVYRCWVSEYTAMPDLDASANTVAIQSIKLENEGWQRDVNVAEPSEPSF